MLFFIVIQEPYELSNINVKVNFKNLEANEIYGYELSDKLLKKTYIKQYYKIGEEDNLLGFMLNDVNSKIQSDKVYKKNNDIFLVGNVVYNDSNIQLFSDNVKYLIQDSILTSDTKTNVIYNNNLLSSNSFKYNIKTSDLVLNEVNLCIKK